MWPPRFLTACRRCPPRGPQAALGRPGAGLMPLRTLAVFRDPCGAFDEDRARALEKGARPTIFP